MHVLPVGFTAVEPAGMAERVVRVQDERAVRANTCGRLRRVARVGAFLRGQVVDRPEQVKGRVEFLSRVEVGIEADVQPFAGSDRVSS